MHIRVEEEFFHEVAARVLTPEDDDQLATAMVEADARTFGRTTKARFELPGWPDWPGVME